jgi:predicted phage-related endonuclease
VNSVEPEVWEITSRGEWLARRRGMMTASRVPALFAGVHPFYDDIEDLWNEIQSGQSIKGESPAMRAGLLLEGIFPAAIAEVHPEWRVVKATTFHTLPSLRLGCTPDFWVNDDGLCQAKTINERDWERGHARPQLYWTLQCLTELIVTGRAWGVLAVIVRSSSLPLHLFAVPRHPAAESKILAAVADFWTRVDAGQLPIVTPRDDIETLLDDGSHVDLSEDNWLPEALEEREKLVAERGSYERRVKYIDAEIKLRMREAATAWLKGWTISWRTQHRNEYVVPEANIRVLRIKRTEDDDG